MRRFIVMKFKPPVSGFKAPSFQSGVNWGDKNKTNWNESKGPYYHDRKKRDVPKENGKVSIFL